MISTYLVEISRFVPLLFWGAVLAAGVIAWVLHRLGQRGVIFALSGLALLAVVALTLLPDGDPSSGGCEVQFSVPFRGIDTLANIGMMVPLALFFGVGARHPLLVLAGVSALAATIEATQALIPALGRRCDTDDWFMNTIGAVLGTIIAVVVLRIEGRRRSRVASLSR